MKAEDRAVAFLEGMGYHILHRNWRFRRYEVDIVAKQNSLLVFCEVKSRRTEDFGTPEVFVNRKKQRNLIQAAGAYLEQHTDEHFTECRFDIIALLIPDSGEIHLEHIRDAFRPYGK